MPRMERQWNANKASERHHSTNLSSRRPWSLTHRVKVEDIKKVNNIKVKESKDRERTDDGRK